MKEVNKMENRTAGKGNRQIYELNHADKQKRIHLLCFSPNRIERVGTMTARIHIFMRHISYVLHHTDSAISQVVDSKRTSPPKEQTMEEKPKKGQFAERTINRQQKERNNEKLTNENE